MFFKIDVPKNFAIFTGKHLSWSLFFKKVAGLKVAVSVDNGPHLSDQRIF